MRTTDKSKLMEILQNKQKPFLFKDVKVMKHTHTDTEKLF